MQSNLKNFAAVRMLWSGREIKYDKQDQQGKAA
jgi:hypothetical protein